MIAVAAMGVGLMSITSAAPAARASSTPASSLPAGATLQPGESLLSPAGTYRLDMQTDGNLVLYNPNCPQGSPDCPYALWSLGTYGQPGNYLVMQTDGNLVLYSRTGQAVWATMSQGTGNADVLRVQDDSNLVVYSGQQAVWYTGTVLTYAHVAGRQVSDLTSLSGRYVFGTPGNSMHTWDRGSVMWGVNGLNDPRVNCSTNGQLVLQVDGNLVWYQPGINGGWVALWNTNTWGTGPTTYLVMQDDGNLVLYDLWHRPLWNSMGFPGVLRVH